MHMTIAEMEPPKMGAFDAWFTKFEQVCEQLGYSKDIQHGILLSKLTPAVWARVEEISENIMLKYGCICQKLTWEDAKAHKSRHKQPTDENKCPQSPVHCQHAGGWPFCAM